MILASSQVLEASLFQDTGVLTDGQPGDLADAEKKLIQETLTRLDWDKPEAARHLGIGLTTLYRKIALFNLTEPGKKLS